MNKIIRKNTKQKKILEKYCYFDGSRKQYLTKRESECLSYVLQAMSAKDIAKEMNIAKKTAEQYIEVLKEKLGCRRKLELIVKAIKDGMTDTILSWTKEN